MTTIGIYLIDPILKISRENVRDGFSARKNMEFDRNKNLFLRREMLKKKGHLFPQSEEKQQANTLPMKLSKINWDSLQNKQNHTQGKDSWAFQVTRIPYEDG
jgi:hypothetical protein